MRSSADILSNPLLMPYQSQADHPSNELIKDAYLVFRALCKLSMKPIPNPEGCVLCRFKLTLRSSDMKSQAMRSKLLALHLMHTLLITHPSVFLTPSVILFTADASKDVESVLFLHAVKQYLCLSLSRNTVSVVPQVFDVAVDIFCRILVSLRSHLKVRVVSF